MGTRPNRMKAVRIEATGDTSVLQYGDYSLPEMGDQDLLVKVMATSVSGWDIKYRRGDLFHGTEHILPGRARFPLPQQLGRECAGTVVSVGKNITQFSIGDRVMGLVHPQNNFCSNTYEGLGNLSTDIGYPGHAIFGSYAQFVARPEHYWMKLPANVSYAEVAAGAWSFPTSHRIIVDRCHVKIGDVVLITGVSGGIGNALTQWAKLSGARVIGTTRKADKIDELTSCGIDKVVVTADLDQAKAEIRDFTNGQGVNHAIELTGVSELKNVCLDTLTYGSTYCPVGEAVTGDSVSIEVKKHLVGLELTVVGIRGSQLKDQYAFLKMLAINAIKVTVAKTMPLKEIALAHQLVEEGSVVGKIILDPWAE